MDRVRLMQSLPLLCILISLFTASSDARSSKQMENQIVSIKHPRSLILKRLGIYSTDPISHNYYYVNSPLSMPPYEDVMGPSSSPQDTNPTCLYSPPTPLPPSTIVPIPTQSPPPPALSTSPPTIIPMPPTYSTPTPPEFAPGPPILFPSPPVYYEPTPPSYVSPPLFMPGPPMFLPPVVYPPPTTSAPPHVGTTPGLWCVAKPAVPDPIVEEAMNYACGSGADCISIQASGKCYQPNTMIAHASFAFNSYWQRTRATGATCDFGGTAMLVTKDPSYGGCNFSIH